MKRLEILSCDKLPWIVISYAAAPGQDVVDSLFYLR